MIKRAKRANVEPVRKRAVLAASLALTSAPVANAYGSVPVPPLLQYQHGYGPGVTQENAAGTAGYNRDTDTIYFQGKAMDPAARAHETGHAFDDQVLNDGDRRYFQRLMQAPQGEWVAGTGLSGTRSPSEWFADYYQAAAMEIDPRRESISSYAQIGPKRLKRFEKALARLAKRQGLKQYL